VVAVITDRAVVVTGTCVVMVVPPLTIVLVTTAVVVITPWSRVRVLVTRSVTGTRIVVNPAKVA
jgi:hypothetical protein